MLKIVNPQLFDTTISERDTSRDRYPGGSIQNDIFMKTSKDSQRRPSPIVRCFLDYKEEATTLDKTPTRIRSILKCTSAGKSVIQVKVTKSGKKFDEAAAIIALPFKGTISGFVFDEGVQLLKAILKNVDPFKHNGIKYSKIVYLVITTNGKKTPTVENAPDVTMYVRNTTGQRTKAAKYSLQTNRYCIYNTLSGSYLETVEPKIEFIEGETKTDLTYEQFSKEAPMVSFSDLVDKICEGNAEDHRDSSTSKSN